MRFPGKAGATALLTMVLAGMLAPARAASAEPENVARFGWVDYRGTDGGPIAPGRFRNPILAGFYSDPSLVRVGRDYYLVNSTFSWFPGIPVFHSRDLVHWRQIGNAIDRPGQLDFRGLTMSRGVYAPSISYHGGVFYIVNTCVDCGGNFVITARNPAGPWSQPFWLKSVEGIDPSLFFDADGRAWLVNNRGPESQPRYDGHRAIWIEQFDPVELKMMGNPKMIVDGGADPSANPIWIEGPHLYRTKGAYYLIAAEGGTATNHSEVVFRAGKIDGPYSPAPKPVNPILTQRDLPSDRADPITSAGHADFVHLPDGRWYAAFLATRPYTGNDYNLGRETFLLPVDWSGAWPVILSRKMPVPRTGRAPLPMTAGGSPMTGTFSVHDDFAGKRLSPEWMTMRGASYRLGGGDLILAPRRDGLGDVALPSFVARRQQHDESMTTTELRFAPAEGEMAGLAAVQNDDFFLTVALTRTNGRTLVRVARRAGKSDPRDGVTIAERAVTISGPVRLRIATHGGRYDFAYAGGATGGAWHDVARGVDATNLSTEKAGGFVGTMIGPFAQGPLP